MIHRNLGERLFDALPKRASVSAYALAGALVAVALLVRLALAPVDDRLPYITFFPAVTLAAILCGSGPGIAATFICTALATFIFTPPYYSVSLDVLNRSLWTNLVFLADGLIICLASSAAHNCRLKAISEAHDNSLHMDALNRERLLEIEQMADNMRMFVKHAPISMAMFDGNMNYLAVSGSWLSDYGRGHADLVGCNHYEIYPDMPDRWRAIHQECQAGKIAKCDEEFWLRADGSSYWLRWAVVPWKNSSNKIGGIIISTEDVTARKLGDEKLKAALLDAKDANNAKSRFLAAASHDLRQPLAALGIYVKSLRDMASPSDQAVVTNMKECICSLSVLLNNLLDLSKLEAGVVSTTDCSFSLPAILSSLQAAHAIQAKEKGLRLRFAPCRYTGRTDPHLFARMLGNLIDNAIRYTERGGIVVGCRRRQGKTWVEVRDSGIGIPAGKTTEIFDEFNQLGDGARNAGSGLGLAIVAKSAALLGLEISVRSTLGRGSVFAIELPLGQPESALLLPADQVAAYRPLRIALVDDNPMVLEAISLALQRLGHQVIAAPDCPTLLAQLGKRPPDILVSDYRLTHGKTGFDAIAEVRQAMGEDLPAMIITGDTDPAVIAAMTGQGIVVLHKPLELEELQAYLEDLTYQG